MQKIRKNQTILFISMMVTAVVLIISLVFTIIFFSDYLVSTILLFTSLSLLGLLLFLNNKFQRQTIFHKYARLIETSNPAYQLKQPIYTNLWLVGLDKKHHYKLYVHREKYSIYYKVADGQSNHKRHQTLFTLLQIHDEDFSFEDIGSAKDMMTFEKELFKTTKFYHQVIFQIKAGKELTKEKMDSTQKVLFINQNKHNLILINVYFFKESNLVYYLNSDIFEPNAYYKLAVNELKKLLS